MLLPLLLFALGGVGPVPPAVAQEVRLAWKFTPGEVLDYVQTTTSRTSTPLGEFTQTQEMRTRLEVLEVADDGSADLRYTFVSVRSVVESAAGRQEYDSGRDSGSDDAGLNPLAGMAGATFRMAVGPDGEIRSLRGMDALLDRILEPYAGLPPEQREAIRSLMEGMFGEDQMRSQVQQGMASLPRGAIRPGEEWSVGVDVPLPFGTTRADYTYRLRDVVSRDGRQVAVMDMTGTMGPLELDDSNPMAGQMDFGGSEITGTTEFDVDRGLLLDSSYTAVMEGEAMGSPMRMETTVRSRLLEE